MAEEIRVEPKRGTVTTGPTSPPEEEASLGVLFRQLADESRTLIRQEVTLAKTELQDNARSLAKNGALIGLGVGMLLVGLLVLTAFLVLGLGRLLDGQYWLSSLIVGGGLALLGAITLLAGRRGLKKDELKPETTVQTIRENREWARAEAEQIKRDLTT